jgi:hypothetical protein
MRATMRGLYTSWKDASASVRLTGLAPMRSILGERVAAVATPTV